MRFIKEGRTRLFVLILALIFAAVSLNGCRESRVQKPEEEEVQTVKKREIVLPMHVISNLNPISSKDEDTYYISKLIYDSLFDYDEGFTPKAELVDEYSYDVDEKQINIVLKDDVKWHDGEGYLGADDVRYTVNAIKAAGKKSPYHSKVKAIAGVSVEGKRSLKITFKKKNNMAVDLLSFPILPKHQYNGPYALAHKKKKFRPIGTGPYRCTNYQINRQIGLKANKAYFGKKATNSIKFMVTGEQENINRLVEAGMYSLAKNETYTRQMELAKENTAIHNYLSNRLEMVCFNMKNEDIARPEVRKAIARAIDNKRIISENYYNCAVTSDSIFPPGYLGSKKLKDDYSKNSEKAKSMLELAGYRDVDGDRMLEDSNRRNFRVNILVDADNDIRVDNAKIIKKNLKNIGIYTNIIFAREKGYEKILKKGDFSILLAGMKVDETFDFRDILDKGGKYNFINYENEELEDAYDELRSGVYIRDIKEKFKKVKDILKEDLPYYCLSYTTYGIIKAPVMKAKISPNFSDIYRGAQEWYTEYEKQEQTDEEKDKGDDEGEEEK